MPSFFLVCSNLASLPSTTHHINNHYAPSEPYCKTPNSSLKDLSFTDSPTMVGVFRKLKESLSSKFSHSKSDSPSHPPRRSASVSESVQSQLPPPYFTSNGGSQSSSSLSQLPRSRSSSSFSRLSRAFSVRASRVSFIHPRTAFSNFLFDS